MSDIIDHRKAAAKIMRVNNPATMGGIFDVATEVYKMTYEDAWAVVDAHYKNHQDPDYRALCNREQSQ